MSLYHQASEYVRPLELVLLEHHGQDLRQLPRLHAVALLAGQHRRLRIAVHGIRVLGEDAVHQPAAGRLGVSGVAALPVFLHLLPVPHFPELLVVDDAALQMRLALLVFFQDLRRLTHLLRPDSGPLQGRRFHFGHDQNLLFSFSPFPHKPPFVALPVAHFRATPDFYQKICAPAFAKAGARCICGYEI